MLLSNRVLRPRYPDADSICLQCLLRLSKRANIPSRRGFGVTSRRRESIAVKPPLIHHKYFSANRVLPFSGGLLQKTAFPERVCQDGTKELPQTAPNEAIRTPLPHSTPIPSAGPSSVLRLPELPHRRRKRLKENRTAASNQSASIPLDASSQLASLSTLAPPASLRRLLMTCLSLSKPRLSFLMVLTTAAAYSLYPVPALLLPPTTISPSLSTLTLVFLTTGTALCAASANALNMMLEPEYDAKMTRTRNRPIVRGLIGKRGAFIFATVAGLIGTGSLWFGVNPTVAFLGGLNIALYAGVYTPLKRVSVLNTWVGALVGGIPPLMGWAAAAGQSATDTGNWHEVLFSADSIGGWLLAGLLYAWQFPHFNGLSWTIRDEYKRAGYRMLVWTNPRMNGRVALRYAVLLFPLCAGLWWFRITDGGFLVTSSIANAWIVAKAWRFWRLGGEKGSARGLFWASVWHLPVVMVLAMAHKKGLWEAVWRWAGWGEEEVAEEEEEALWERKENWRKQVVN